MTNEPSLQIVERKIFRAAFQDGLWELLISCFILMFVLAPFLSESMGDFWSSVVFLPFWALVYIVVRLIRKNVVAPRMGKVNFSQPRKRKLRLFTIFLLVVNTLALIAGILAFLLFDRSSLGSGSIFNLYNTLMGAFMLLGFSAAAYLLDYPLLFLYGLLLFAALPFGEWLYLYHNVSHHGLPITFGAVIAIILLIGLVKFILFLKNNPLPNPASNQDGNHGKA
jgi:hypothetical protein